MSHEVSGSAKLKGKCQTIANLTPEEINQIAGGAYTVLPSWLIRGTPAFWSLYKQPTLPSVDVDFGGFGF